jgi:hypothetical protein
VTDDEAHTALLERLKEASDFYALGGSNNHFKGYLLAVLAVDEFLAAIGIPLEMTAPLRGLRYTLLDATLRSRLGKKSGGQPRLAQETFSLALAAAAVTVLKERKWLVDDALKKIAATACVDRKRLKSFRDNINRGLADKLTAGIYNEYLEAFRQLSPPDDDLLSLVRLP